MTQIPELRGIAMILASSLPGLLIAGASAVLAERRRATRRNAHVSDE